MEGWQEQNQKKKKKKKVEFFYDYTCRWWVYNGNLLRSVRHRSLTLSI